MFELALFGAVIVSGIIILVYKYALPEQAKQDPEPIALDYARSFFPVLLIVFLLRGFIVEPFRIPSGSMLPTLEVGDFILVNKFTYGVRLPILHKKIVEMNQPKRGDVVVFRYPDNEKISYIKRLVGLPGDVIQYRNRQLFVNGAVVKSEHVGNYIPTGKSVALQRFTQTIETSESNEQLKYATLLKKRSGQIDSDQSWIVPQGHYFMMGDNRGNSSDSREWGFLPEPNIIGKAFFIWFHWNFNDWGDGIKLSRVGGDMNEGHVGSE